LWVKKYTLWRFVSEFNVKEAFKTLKKAKKGKKRQKKARLFVFLFGSQLQIASATCGNFFVWLA
jgi:hypothetical protein